MVDQVAGTQVMDQVAGTQVVDQVTGAQVRDQVAGTHEMVKQVAGTQGGGSLLVRFCTLMLLI